jgi:hypothetical protein
LKTEVDFWHAANVAFTAEERAAFNVWKTDLYLAVDALRDDARAVAMYPGISEWRKEAMLERVNGLMDMVCHVPSLEE